MQRIITLAIALLFSSVSLTLTAQVELSIQVSQVYPPLSIEYDDLVSARTISDLQPNFDTSWIAKYESVKITTESQGRLQSAYSKANELSIEQLNLLRQKDPHSPVKLTVDYFPDNTLKSNDIASLNFDFEVHPKHPAVYPGGIKALKAHFMDHLSSGLEDGVIREHGLAAVKFTVTDSGAVQGIELLHKSLSHDYDELMKKAVCNMQAWKPARHIDGLASTQEFVLTVGDHRSCVLNLLPLK